MIFSIKTISFPQDGEDVEGEVLCEPMQEEEEVGHQGDGGDQTAQDEKIIDVSLSETSSSDEFQVFA